jgi:hypothetical protein
MNRTFWTHRWAEEELSDIGSKTLKEVRTLQSIIDPFVTSVGGELICDLVGNNNPQSSADYLFRRHNVIAELKSLQAGSFMGSFQRKFGRLMGRWDREGRLRVYGTTQIDSSTLPSDCRDEMFGAMAESLQKHVVLVANNQIRSTKSLLSLPDAKGLLWVASDGNEDLQPNLAWYLLTRTLQKKRENGDPAYSNIDGVAYFNPRMLAQVPQAIEPAMLWFSGCRKPSQGLATCLKELSDGWPKYVAWAQGITVRDVGGKPEDARFLGVEPKLPKIEISYK